MPKGIRSVTSPISSGEDDVKMTIVLHREDLAALEALARDQYRTHELQAAYLLARVLREAGHVPVAPAANGHAERIIDRARQQHAAPAPVATS